MNTKIETIASFVPEKKITNKQIEEKIAKSFPEIPF
jgi:3-oxoacyl-[acyl-carrier-protein] synthase III